jgi:hypothetical protein
MKQKVKVDLTLEAILSAIAAGATSLTAVSKAMGLSKGAVSGSTAKAIRKLMPDVDGLLAANKAPKGVAESGKVKIAKKVAKGKTPDKKPAKGGTTPKVKTGGAKVGKWPRDSKNPFREGSYGTCYDILAAPAHKGGLAKEKLVELLAEATGKDIKHAAYDAQVILTVLYLGLNLFGRRSFPLKILNMH